MVTNPPRSSILELEKLLTLTGGFKMAQEQATVNDIFRVLGMEYFNKMLLIERVTALEKMLEQQSQKSGNKPITPEVVE